MSAGGAGLTLVQANHVFLLEPALDPAVEQQAVARVHRIGQTRPVVCTRLLIDGSVERAVLQINTDKQALFAGHGDGPGEAEDEATTLASLPQSKPHDDAAELDRLLDLTVAPGGGDAPGGGGLA